MCLFLQWLGISDVAWEIDCQHGWVGCVCFDWVTCILKRWVRVWGLIVGIEGCSCDLIIACWLFKTKVWRSALFHLFHIFPVSCIPLMEPWPLFTHTRSLARLARPRLPRYCNVQFGQRWSEHFRASPSSVVASRDLRPLLLWLLCHWWLASGQDAHRERGGQCGRRLLQSSASEGFGGVGWACHG